MYPFTIADHVNVLHCVTAEFECDAETLELLTFFIRAYLYVYVCVGV